MLGAIYNTCAYLIPQRISNTLIVLFYIVSYMVTTCYIISAIFFIKNPENMFYNYNLPPSLDISVIAWDLADCGMIALGLIILFMTIKIIFSIHVLYGGIQFHTAARSQCVIKVIMWICVVSHIGGLLTFYIVPDFQANTVALLECVMTFMLTLLFSMTMCQFLSSLRIYKIR